MSPPESNFNGTIILNDPEGLTTDGELSYIRPTSREALVDALTILSERKATPKKIVVIGGFTSFDFPQLHLEEQSTDLSTSARGLRSPHLVVDCSGMNRILDVDTLSLTVTVEAGITYWDLANQLRTKGLAVANLSAYPEVTVGGGSGTGTHGSGYGVHGKNLADQFISLEVVTARGEVQQITDTRLFTHLGVLGVVTSITLRCIPMFFLKQTCYEFADLDAFDSLRVGAFLELVQTEHFYSTMIRIDLVDKKHHPLMCYIRRLAADEDDQEFEPSFLGADLVENVEGEKPSVFSGPYFDVLCDHTTASWSKVPAPRTYYQAEYFVNNKIASKAVHAFLHEADKDDCFMKALPTGIKCRFVSGDDQWMSSTANVDGVGLYIALQLSLYGSRAEIDAILKRIEDCFEEHDIPFSCHWGKLCSGGHGKINRKLQDRAKAMNIARCELDPDNVFLDAESELAKLFGYIPNT